MSEFYSSDTSLSTPSYPPPSPATWSVEVFYGPLYWGFVLATSLVGATVVQAYMYFSRNSDRWSLRLLVTVLLILDVASTVLMGQAIFHYFVVNFANVDVFFEVPISWWAEKALSTLITCMTQLYFASRIYIINRTCAILPGYGRFLPVAVSFFAVAGLMGGLSETYFMSVWPTSQFASTTMQVIVILEDGSAVLSDILVTTTLSYILSPSRTGVVQRSSRLRNLFFFVMNRGIIVTIFQVGVLVAYLGARSYLYWMPFHLCKSKLYANTLLAMLNSREIRHHSRANNANTRPRIDDSRFDDIPVLDITAPNYPPSPHAVVRSASSLELAQDKVNPLDCEDMVDNHSMQRHD